MLYFDVHLNFFNVLNIHNQLFPIFYYRHPIIKKLHRLISSDKDLANMVAQQLFSNAMVTAGLLMDARNLITNINDLLIKALEKH